MRLLPIVCAGLVATAPAAAAPPPGKPPAAPKYSAPAHCPKTTSHYAFEPGKPLKPRKLNELPPANAYAAVLRHRNGCEVPLVVRYNVGGQR